MKNLEKDEISKLEQVLKLVKEEIKKNNLLYSRMLKDTNDEDLIYQMSNTYSTKIKNLEKALISPYFARIEFKANGVRIDIWTHFMRGCIIDYVH